MGARHVVVIVEDAQLAELLLDALHDAGHTGEVATAGDLAALERNFDAAIVDLDTRARNGSSTVALLRQGWPRVTVIALLPCGGLPPGHDPVPYHLSLEKPARLQALMAALSCN
jgi:DNA-binding NtrC family response regulator